MQPTRAYSRYLLSVFCCMGALNVLDRQVLATLLEPIKLELDVSDTAMGFLAGTSFTIVHLAAALPVARWADRGNRRSIIALGVFLWSAFTAATGLARSFVQVFVLGVEPQSQGSQTDR